MPEPQYIDQTQAEPLRKVRPVPGFEEYAPAEAFGGGKSAFAEATDRTMEKYSDVQNQHEAEAHKAAIDDLFAKGAEASNDALTKHDLTRGKDAFNVQKSTEDLRNYWDDLVSQLPDDKSKDMLRQRFSQLDIITHHGFNKHIGEQAQEQGIQGEQNSNATFTTLASKYPEMADELRKYITYNSYFLDPTAETQKFNYAVAHTLIQDGKISQAQDYVKNNTFSDAHLAQLENGLSQANINQQALQYVNEARKSSDPAKVFVDIDDPKIKKAAETMFSKDISIQQKVLKETQEKQFDSISDMMRKKPSVPPSMIDPVGFKSLPTKMQQSLDRIYNQKTTPEEDASTWGHWSSLSQEEIKQMSKSDLVGDFTSRMNSHHTTDAMEVWEQYHSKNGGPKEKKYAITQEQIKDALISGKFWNSADSKKNQLYMGELTDAVKRDIDAYEVGGKVADSKTIQGFVNDQVTRNYRKGFLGNILNPTGRFVQMHDIDKDFKTKVEKIHPEWSDEQIIAAWNAYNVKH